MKCFCFETQTFMFQHFFMVCIVDRLQKTLNRKISSEQIWKHLKTMYNLKALDDLEPLPFPNNEENFDLPFELQTKLKRSESEDGESSSKETERKASNTVSSPSTQKLNANKSFSSNTERNDRKSHKASESERIQPKRTRGSIHHDVNADGNNSSPASTPPPQQTKRRRI